MKLWGGDGVIAKVENYLNKSNEPRLYEERVGKRAMYVHKSRGKQGWILAQRVLIPVKAGA